MRVTLLPRAEADLRKGQGFYEEKCPGLGEIFWTTLIMEIEALPRLAGVHRKIFGFHRYLSDRFPFGVYYVVESGDLIVVRVLDCRSDPRSIRKALRP